MNRRDALRSLAAGSAAGSLAAGALVVEDPAVKASPPDPLLNLVERTRAALEVVSSMTGVTGEEFDAAMEPVNALFDEMAYRTPTATSEAGALAALRFAHETMEHSAEIFDRPLVGAALAFFERAS